MSSPSSPNWLQAATRRRASYANLRVSDAERTEVADLLSKHYGDGRLDQAEFNQRLDQAMNAKTYADLSGLFTDLPRTEAEATEAPGVTASRRHRRHPGALVLLILIVILLASAAPRVLMWSISPLVWIALVAAIIYATMLRRGSS